LLTFFIGFGLNVFYGGIVCKGREFVGECGGGFGAILIGTT